jgi:hypothetical protein
MPAVRRSRAWKRSGGDRLQQGRIAGLVGVVHHRDGERLVAEPLPELVYPARPARSRTYSTTVLMVASRSQSRNISCSVTSNQTMRFWSGGVEMPS